MMKSLLFRTSYIKCNNRKLSNISASLVKELREKSGAPMMDCKKALAASDVNGDINKAMDWLRAKGISKVTSAVDRLAAEGLIILYTNENDNKATLVEVNSETDFVGRNKQFQEFAAIVAATASKAIVNDKGYVDVEKLLQSTPIIPSEINNNKNVVQHKILNDILGDIVTTIREKIVINRAYQINADNKSIINGYVHGKVGTEFLPSYIQMGKSSAIVKIKNTNNIENNELKVIIKDMTKKLAMHIVATNPLYLKPELIPSDVIEKEKKICKEQLDNLGNKAPKPDMVEKVLMGKLNKKLSEICLIGQNHVAEEGAPIISKFINDFSKKHNISINIENYAKWDIGSS